MKILILIFSNLCVVISLARNIEDNKSSLAGAYKDYDEMYNGGYLSEQEKKIIGVEEDSPHSIRHVSTTSFKDIKESITPQWYSFTEQQNIYDISNLDMSSYRQQHFYKLQDLGTYGTPVKLFNHTINHKIVQTDGYEAFKFYTPEDVIYDTRAPLLGFRTMYNKYNNSFDLNMFFALSLNKNIHFGIRGRPIFQERLFGLIEKDGEKNKNTDMNVIQIPLSAYLFLRSDDDKHLLYLRLSMAHRKIRETGGIKGHFRQVNTVVSGLTNNIDDDDIIKTNDVFYKVLIYYQYRFQNFYAYIKNKFKIKNHHFDCNIDEEVGEKNDGAKGIIIKKKYLHEKTVRYLFTNSKDLIYDEDNCCRDYLPFNTTDHFIIDNLEIGVKKYLHPHVFLRGFIQFNFFYRTILHNVYNDGHLKDDENSQKFPFISEPFIFCGIANIYDVKIHGTVLFLKILKMENWILKPCLYFNFSAKYEKQFLNISLDVIRQQVPEIFQYYSIATTNDRIRIYDHFTKNQFKDPFKIQLNANSNLKIFNDKLIIKPYGNIILHTNHLFFVQTKNLTNSSCEPKQNKEWLLDLYRGIFSKINIVGPFFVDIDAAINKRLRPRKSWPWNGWAQSNNEVLNNIPLFNIYGRFYFCEDFARGVASMAGGVDILWATPHNPDKYDPITQQFFQQELESAVNRYPIIGGFFNFRFGGFAFSAKINNLLQCFFVNFNYNDCITPYYPAFRSGYTLTMQYIFVD